MKSMRLAESLFDVIWPLSARLRLWQKRPWQAGIVRGIENMLAWLNNHIEIVVAVLSAVIAVFGALVSRNETRKQRALQMENLRHSIDAQSLSWGNACIDTLNRAAMFARTRQHQANDQSFFQQRVNMLLAISSLVERGRLFFPNIDPGSKGGEKEGAYRGSRPPSWMPSCMPIMKWKHCLVRAGRLQIIAQNISKTAADCWCQSCKPILTRGAAIR